MKIEIEGKEFEIDVERAKELGVCKEVQKIEDIKAGDVYEHKYGRVMIIQPLNGKQLFNIAGIDGLIPYGNFNELLNREEMIKFLNDEECKFAANINEQINELIENA